MNSNVNSETLQELPDPYQGEVTESQDVSWTKVLRQRFTNDYLTYVEKGPDFKTRRFT